MLRIKRKLSTAFHPQTDGQTERVNQTLETYLRMFINYDQDEWYQLLPLAEFAYNNSYRIATKMTPFYANYGFHPKTIWPNDQSTRNPASTVYGHWLKSIHQRAAETLEETKNRMGKYYDQGKLPTPQYNPGDWVMLNAKNIRTKRPTKKLAPKFYGPFKITKKIGSHAYELELESRWRIHNVFHVSLLEPHHQNKFSLREQVRPEPEEIEGEKEYEVEKIVQGEIRTTHRKIWGRNKVTKSLYFLVKWKGYPEDECTWEPGKHLSNAAEQVEEFYKENPEAPAIDIE